MTRTVMMKAEEGLNGLDLICEAVEGGELWASAHRVVVRIRRERSIAGAQIDGEGWTGALIER